MSQEHDVIIIATQAGGVLAMDSAGA